MRQVLQKLAEEQKENAKVLVEANNVNGMGRPVVPLHKPYWGDTDHTWVPNGLNTAVWISKIPPQASRKQIFAAFKEGKIYYFSKSEPIPGAYNTAGASVAFGNRKAAQNFFDRAQDPARGVFIEGQRVRVVWDRHPSLGFVGEKHPFQSRVVRFYIPAGHADLERFQTFLDLLIDYNLVEDTVEWFEFRGARKVVQLSFESIRGQSRAAVKAFLEFASKTGKQGYYYAKYAKDPCDQA
jgi:hypothetical protein